MNKSLIVVIFFLFSIFWPFDVLSVMGCSTDNESFDYHIFHMPIEYAEHESHTGIASLAMMFQYYGCSIDQMIINNISGTNVGIVKGTPLNGYIDAINANYTGRDYGYEAEVSFLTDNTSAERWNILKKYVENETPVVLGTKYSKTGIYYIHYRILIGYDERTNVLIFNDPYQGYDASAGPYSDFPYKDFSSRWANTDYLLIQIKPIELKVEIPARPIEFESKFLLFCQINCSNLNNTPSKLNVDLQLPSGYSIISGQLTSQLKVVEQNNLVNWTLQSSEYPSFLDEIKVKVTYPNGNYTFGNYVSVRPRESLAPQISAPSTNSLFDQDYVSPEFRVDGNINISTSISYDVYLVTYDYHAYPDYKFHQEFLGTNQSILNYTLGPYKYNQTLIFCWFLLETSYGIIYKSPIKLYRVLIPETSVTTTDLTNTSGEDSKNDSSMTTSDQVASIGLSFVLIGLTTLYYTVHKRE